MVKILLREVFNLSRISLTKTKTILSIAPRCFRRKQNQIKRKVWSSLSREYPLSENYFREEISGAAVFLQEMLIFGQTGNHNIIHLDNIFCYKIFLSYNMESAPDQWQYHCRHLWCSDRNTTPPLLGGKRTVFATHNATQGDWEAIFEKSNHFWFVYYCHLFRNSKRTAMSELPAGRDFLFNKNLAEMFKMQNRDIDVETTVEIFSKAWHFLGPNLL